MEESKHSIVMGRNNMIHSYTIQAIYREALLWRQLRHPYVLELLGLDDKSFADMICMVSPWMHNGDMARYIRGHPDIDMRQRILWVSFQHVFVRNPELNCCSKGT